MPSNPHPRREKENLAQPVEDKRRRSLWGARSGWKRGSGPAPRVPSERFAQAAGGADSKQSGSTRRPVCAPGSGPAPLPHGRPRLSGAPPPLPPADAFPFPGPARGDCFPGPRPSRPLAGYPRGRAPAGSGRREQAATGRQQGLPEWAGRDPLFAHGLGGGVCSGSTPRPGVRETGANEVGRPLEPRTTATHNFAGGDAPRRTGPALETRSGGLLGSDTSGSGPRRRPAARPAHRVPTSL